MLTPPVARRFLAGDSSPMALVYIALGSNIRPEANLAAAARALGGLVAITGRSPVYRTPPWGYAAQADFLNAVVAAQTALAPPDLLARLLALETSLGRERTIANGPRTIDLDLLCYDAQVLDTPQLTLPHPRLHERAFVLVPLCDLAPGLLHPVLGKTMAELLAGVETEGVVKIATVLPG